MRFFIVHVFLCSFLQRIVVYYWVTGVILFMWSTVWLWSEKGATAYWINFTDVLTYSHTDHITSPYPNSCPVHRRINPFTFSRLHRIVTEAFRQEILTCSRCTSLRSQFKLAFPNQANTRGKEDFSVLFRDKILVCLNSVAVLSFLLNSVKPRVVLSPQDGYGTLTTRGQAQQAAVTWIELCSDALLQRAKLRSGQNTVYRL